MAKAKKEYEELLAYEDRRTKMLSDKVQELKETYKMKEQQQFKEREKMHFIEINGDR